MKHFRLLSVFALFMLLAVSCENEDITSGYESQDATYDSEAINGQPANAIESINLADCFIIRNVYNDGVYDGCSWLTAHSNGKMADDAFAISLYFKDIDKVNAGTAIKGVNCLFTFYYSCHSDNSTGEYSGRIILKEKGDDYAIIHFDKVVFSVHNGDYAFDGDLKFPVLDKYPWDNE